MTDRPAPQPVGMPVRLRVLTLLKESLTQKGQYKFTAPTLVAGELGMTWDEAESQLWELVLAGQAEKSLSGCFRFIGEARDAQR